jgi:sulfur-oxidizing protein SoxZ
METGRRKDQSGNLVPSHHITEIKVMVNGSEVMEGQWGTGIAKNPYMSLQYYGKKGDIVNLKLLDNKKNNFFVETVVK